jgi:hypothetical protein
MNYEIYCDESQPDVFWSQSNERAKYLMIGGLWLPAELRQDIKHDIRNIKEEFRIKSEFKWHKVHSSKELFYMALIDLFMKYGDQLRFRCIAVEGDKVDLVKFHESDAELGFYKFYYQAIVHWIFDFNEYRIFCDEKTNRVGDRLKTLRRTLDCSNISSKIISVQALPSKESVLIQLTDLLLGMASSRLNETVKPESIKEKLIVYLEQRLGVKLLGPTRKIEQKFNIFKINLQGGW